LHHDVELFGRRDKLYDVRLNYDSRLAVPHSLGTRHL
jgi:hypothetical protein